MTIIDMRFVILLSSCLGILLCISNCGDTCQETRTYTQYEYTYQSISEIRDQFDIVDAKDLVRPGKIYLYNDHLFINESGEGIHIIDNRDKSNPLNISFINIPGNVDMAVKNNVLYVDSYMDLLAIDISDLNNIELLSRTEDVFPSYNSGDDFIVTWETFDTTITYNCNDDLYFYDDVRLEAASIQTNASVSTAQIGIGGSFARFAIYRNNLYTIDYSNMTVFDITNLSQPTSINTIHIGWNIETIITYHD